MKTQNTLTARLFRREYVVFILMSLTLALGVYYLFLINQTIGNAVKEREMRNSIVELRKDIAGLEVSFIEKESGLTLDYAHERGFKNFGKRQFVNRDTNLTLR
jgi:hypothetical protein